MSRKTPETKAKLLSTHFGAQYQPLNNFLAEVNLMHSTKLTAVGGEVKLNDSNTLVEVGVSDFNGRQIPTTENGYIDALVIGYGKEIKQNEVTNPALVTMSHKRADFPNWLLNSELVLKKNSNEQIRIRVSELVIDEAPQVVRAEWVKELERTIKIEGNQELEITLASAKGAALSATHDEFIAVNFYGVKFSNRKTA